jgi:hypothetical protein
MNMSVRFDSSGQVRVQLPLLELRITGRLVVGTQQIRLTLHKWFLWMPLALKLVLWLVPWDVRAAVNRVSGTEIDIHLEKLQQPIRRSLDHLTVTQFAIPGEGGAVLSAYFHWKE